MTHPLCQRLSPDLLRPAAPNDLDEPRGRYQGRGDWVARPGSVQEVAEVMRACSDLGIAVVPRGGGTGLVGGSVMPDCGAAPVILSLERMRAVRAIHPAENAMIVEAGATLAEVRDAAEQAGRLFPLSLASEGSAQIGGILATNAGGVNVLRYGNARELCLGVEAVLPDGRILSGLKRLRKDNTGYDLRDLLIGAEGTLAVITAASLRLYPRPVAEGVAMLAVPSPKAALDLLALAQDRLAGGVTAFELISTQGLRFLDETGVDLRRDFVASGEWAVLIEVNLPFGLSPDDSLAALFEQAYGRDLVTDGVIAQSGAQAAALWALREHIPEANRRIGAIASHDISLPLSEIAGFIEQTETRLTKIARDFDGGKWPIRINCFGHLGDGNLHYNLFPAKGVDRAVYDPIRAALTEAVHDEVMARDGSFSAEHGIGRLKVGDLERWGDPTRIALMRQIKTVFDPKGILNPGAVLR